MVWDAGDAASTCRERADAARPKGMRFKEVREYQPGDDIRFIDWNVSARFGHPFSKLFEEERELSFSIFNTSGKKYGLGEYIQG